MVVKGETKALCPYAVAAHSMGLWQNDLDVTFKLRWSYLSTIFQSHRLVNKEPITCIYM